VCVENTLSAFQCWVPAPASLPTVPGAVSSAILCPLCGCSLSAHTLIWLACFMDSAPPSGLNAPQPIKTGLDRPAVRAPCAWRTTRSGPSAWRWRCEPRIICRAVFVGLYDKFLCAIYCEGSVRRLLMENRRKYWMSSEACGHLGRANSSHSSIYQLSQESLQILSFTTPNSNPRCIRGRIDPQGRFSACEDRTCI
jgi:hypothetical protein